MRLKPMQDRIIVKKRDDSERGGIMLPRGVGSERHVFGVIVACGPGSRFSDGTLLPLAVAVGDTVMYGRDAGEPFPLDGEDYTVLREGDIVGILGAAPLVAVAKARL